jgi:hypothetical protein
MAVKTIEELRSQSETVRDETVEEANSAQRIGNNFLDVIDTLNQSVSALQQSLNAESSARQQSISAEAAARQKTDKDFASQLDW